MKHPNEIGQLTVEDEKSTVSNTHNETLQRANVKIGERFRIELTKTPKNISEEIKQYCLKLSMFRLTLKKKYEEAKGDIGVFRFFLETLFAELEKQLQTLSAYSERCNTVVQEGSTATQVSQQRLNLDSIDDEIYSVSILLDKAKQDYFFINRCNISTSILIQKDIESIKNSSSSMPIRKLEKYQTMLKVHVPELEEHCKAISTENLLLQAQRLESSDRDFYFGKGIINAIFKRVNSSDNSHFFLLNQNSFKFNELQVYYNKKLSDLKKYKLALLLNKIERKLDNSITKGNNQPWPLGWAGSNSFIQYKGKIFKVPQGIAEVYKNSKLMNYAVVNEILIDKLQGSGQSFFKTITGTKRSKDTNEEYKQLRQLVSI